MNSIIEHKELVEILSSYDKYRLIGNCIEVNKDALKLDKVERLGLNVERLHETDRILLENKIRVYNSIETFLNSNKITIIDNILILEDQEYYSFVDNKTYINFILKEDYFLFNNSISYIQFIKELKKLESEIDGTFHFIDSFNTDSRKITMVSLAEKSRVNISFNSIIPKLDVNKNLDKDLKLFISCFDESNKNLARFLKNATINTIINYEPADRMQKFFENLNAIVYKAKINFEVYLNELSIDKIKKDYDEVKTKYFSSLSDMLSKITTSILALPIAIATLLFAIEKLKETSYYMYLLIVIIIVSSIFITSLLRVYYSDLNFTKKLLEKDYNTLIENNFFTKYNDEKEIFEEVKKRVTDRIVFLKNVIESYFWIMNLSNLAIIGLMLYYLGLTDVQIIIPLLLILLVIGLFRNHILDNKNVV